MDFCLGNKKIKEKARMGQQCIGSLAQNHSFRENDQSFLFAQKEKSEHQ